MAVKREKTAITRSTEPAANAAGGFQDPHELVGAEPQNLEACIGAAVRAARNRQGLTAIELARRAELSPAMLSKIENGATSPSLSTLQALSKALDVPLTALFEGFEETRDATFVKSGEGLTIERRGTRAGHQYQLLGHADGRSIRSNPTSSPSPPRAIHSRCSSTRGRSSST